MSRPAAFSAVISASIALIEVSVLGCSNSHPTRDGGPPADGAAVTLGSASAGSADAGPVCDAFGDAGAPDGGACRFQGTIQIAIEESPDKPMARADELPATERYTFTALGDAYRWDLFEHSVARGDFRVYDRSAHRFYTVMQSQSVIFAVPESDQLLADKTAAFVLEDVGKVGHVAGVECKLFHTTTPTATYDICATDKLTPFPFQMMPGIMQRVVPFGAELVNRKLYPLLVNQYLTGDAGVSEPVDPKMKGRKRPHPDYTFRAMVIEQNAVDPMLFQLPKYTIQRIDLLQAGPKNKR